MNETRYLVDNNALMGIKRSRVRSRFFRDNCLLTADVLFEAGDHPEWLLLESCAVEMNVGVLEQVRRVMASLEVGDTRLVDLYQNHGTADPGVIAYVLRAIAEDETTFFPDEWFIVTADKAVVEVAARFEISTMSPSELAAIIDSDSVTSSRA